MAELDPTHFANLQENLAKIALSNITSVTLNTDALKTNFEVIVEILKGLVKKADNAQLDGARSNKDLKELREKLENLADKQNSDKAELSDKIANNERDLRNTQDQTKDNTNDIAKLQDSLKDLQDKFDAKSILDKLNQHDRQIQELLDRINSLANSANNGNSGNSGNNGKSGSSGNIDSDSRLSEEKLNNLQNALNGMQSAFDEKLDALKKTLDDFVRKDTFNTYAGKTDGQLNSHQNSIDDLYNKIKEFNSKLSDKLNCDSFDEHINDYNNLKNIVINLANNANAGAGGEKNVVTQQITQQVISSGAALSTKDANLLKELGQKFPELEALVRKLQKEFGEHAVAYKLFADESWRKIAINGELITALKTDTNKKIHELEAAIKALRDQLLNFGTSSSNNSSGGKATGVDENEIRRIQMALSTITDRLNQIEKEISDLRQLKDKVNTISDIANDNSRRISSAEEDIQDLKGLKSKIEALERLLRETTEIRSSSKFNRLGSSESLGNNNNNTNINAGGVTLDQVRQIVGEEIGKLRDELLALIDELRAELEKKADSEDLYKSEAALLEKLDQIAGALMKRAQADKNDTKKALMFLEKKIKEITVIVLGSPGNSEEGAIFAKKPWTPWSCASCDSKLKDYPGALIDNKNWNKMPQRETDPARLTQGKFGKGWTKWTDSKRMTAEKGTREMFSASSTKGFGEALPEIHRDVRGQQVDSARNE